MAGIERLGGKTAENGDLAMASRMLAGQASTLESMFGICRRAAFNMTLPGTLDGLRLHRPGGSLPGDAAASTRRRLAG